MNADVFDNQEALVEFSAQYRAVGNKCAVNLDTLDIGMTKEKILALLMEKKFSEETVDLVSLARSRIGFSRYKRGSRLSEAPDLFDCSSFVKWLYAERGIWIPRRSIQQSVFGTRVSLSNIMGGDIIMTSGLIDYFFDDPKKGIGHVGMATGEGTVVHAANSVVHIIESSIDAFVADGRFRELRRIIPPKNDVRTFITPKNREVESADDIKWILLQNKPT